MLGDVKVYKSAHCFTFTSLLYFILHETDSIDVCLHITL